jgi:ribosomal protein L28
VFIRATVAKCPVCGRKEVLADNVSLSENRFAPIWFCKRQDVLDYAVRGTAGDPHSDRTKIHWACNACIRSNKAILADPKKQTFCDCYPYYAYFDETRKCSECGRQYVFTKEEQQYWYETLRFWVQSRPKKCKECYKKEKASTSPKPPKNKDI